MSRADAWLLHLSNLLVGGTGLVYAFFLYLLEPVDPYAVIHHPWQPFVQHAHVWTAPLLVFAVGMIWRQHVWRHVQRGQRRGRAMGLVLICNLAPMVASGYFLQTAVEPGWRTAWMIVHLGTGALWLAGYAVHVVTASKRARVSALPRDV